MQLHRQTVYHGKPTPWRLGLKGVDVRKPVPVTATV